MQSYLDQFGNDQLIGSFGEALIGSKIDDISVQFQYDQLNTEFDLDLNETNATGDGSITANGSVAIASTVSNGTASIQSKDAIRYVPGHTAYADFTASFVGNGIGYAGPHDDEDGFAIKVNNNVLSFGYIKSGIETSFVNIDGWNGFIDTSTIDFTKLNIFRIVFGYLGVANPTLWIRLNKWYPLVSLKTEGVNNATHIDNPVLPIRIRAINGMTIKTGSWNGGVLGNIIKSGRSFHFPNTQIVDGVSANQGEMTLNSTDVGTVVIFRMKDIFQGKTNKVKAKLLSYEFKVDIPIGNVDGSVIFQIVASPTLSGVASYSDINSNSSIVEYDHTPGSGASVNASNGIPIITSTVEYVGTNKGGTTGSAQIEADKLGAIGYKGDIFAIIAKDIKGNNVNVRVNLNWEELF